MGWANCRGAQVRKMKTMVLDWYSQCTSPITGKCEIVTCMDPQGGKIQLGLYGYVHGPFCLLWWGWVRLICPWKGEARGGSGLPFGTRTSSTSGVASSGSDALGSLGAITPTSGSALGIGNGALPVVAGAMGSFSATSNISRLARSSLLCCSAEHLGGILEWIAHLWGP